MTKRKILLVDDSMTSLLMEQMVLNQGPYDLVTARDGAEAVEKALRERPDLVLMDVVMPRKTGFEACSEMRRHDQMRAVPIILVTTRGEAENVERGFASGFTDYITKPFSGLELMTKVKSYLTD